MVGAVVVVEVDVVVLVDVVEEVELVDVELLVVGVVCPVVEPVVVDGVSVEVLIDVVVDELNSPVVEETDSVDESCWLVAAAIVAGLVINSKVEVATVISP